MEHKINKQENNNDNTIKMKVLDLIENDKIKQTSKLYFSIKDSTFWLLCFISIILGSVAFSVIIFNFANSEAELYQMTSDSLFDFILDMTPYLWIFLFTAFAFIGYENFRYTSKGYRYSFYFILVMSLTLSVTGGVILHLVGVSEYVDKNMIPEGYIIKTSDGSRGTLWNQPQRGILSGEIIGVTASGTSFILKDFNNNIWTIDSVYVPDVNLYLISTSSKVRVVGFVQAPNSTSSPYVEACYIFPWDRNEYVSKTNDLKKYLNNADEHERNISIRRNNDCKAVRPYNIIKQMVEVR